MRGSSLYGLLHLGVLFSVALFFIQGCARSVLQTYPASEQEIAEVLNAFASFREKSGELCGCCLDAEADAALSFSGWFSDHTGKISGYLQAMEPGYIKFVAVNPLGQPLFILLTDGKRFNSIDVSREKAYAGSVRSEGYKKFVPQGFEPEFSYYWLTGRLRPGEIRIREVMRSSENEAFWLAIRFAGSSQESMILFDPDKKTILRHILQDGQGVHLLDIHYTEQQLLPGREGSSAGVGMETASHSDPAGKLCRVPDLITVFSNGGARKIEVKLHSFMKKAEFTTADFHIVIPENFEQLLVE